MLPDVKYINSIVILDFRCFQNQRFRLGRYLTAISGQNATGKSTLLSLLGHCAELKVKEGRPLLQRQFRTEFGEIMKASLTNDKKHPFTYNIFLTHQSKGYSLSIPYRSTFQKYKSGKRFRLIPLKSEERKESKISWPTLYLGLSRLYPIGESKGVKPTNFNLQESDMAHLIEHHKKLLSLKDEINGCSEISIQETPKRTVGVSTNTYDPIANSAGQDNINQILLAIMSFEKLRNEQGDSWGGGLLLIDEIDATLHPQAQNVLINYLYEKAKHLGIQIIFTTHSLSLLEHICERCNYENSEDANPIEVLYLTTRNDYLEVLSTPEFTTIYNDLLTTSNILISKPITVYAEDDEARWFINKLTRLYGQRINLPAIKLGKNVLIDLLRNDYRHFRNYIFIFDGDVNENDLKEVGTKVGFLNKIPPNVLLLPGGTNPEKALYDFINNTDGKHEIFSSTLSGYGFTKKYIRENGPDSYDQFEEERRRNKAWFTNNEELAELIYPYWEESCEHEVEVFRQKFIASFNEIAKRIRIPLIT